MDDTYYYLNARRRSVAQDPIARQPLRHVGFVLFYIFLAVSYGHWLPMPPWGEGVAARLAVFALALILYWAVGWLPRYRVYRTARHAETRGASDLICWVVAVGAVSTGIIGSDDLAAVIASLIAVTLGLVALLWMVIRDLRGKRKPAHWFALWLLIFSAGLLHSSTPTGQEAAFGFICVGVGLAVGVVLDERRLVKSFPLRVEEA
jgi:hypothetical protein